MNIDKITQDPQERILLSKVYEKIDAALRRQIPGNTGFLSPREQELCRYLFGQVPGLCFFGGYPDAERRMLCYLPEYLEERALYDDHSPVVCLQAAFYQGDVLTHRDFLGALMGAGISRESVGDILVSQGRCDFLVTKQIAPFLLQEFTGAGRVKVRLTQIPLAELVPPEAQVRQIRDTISSLRLDAAIASGFRIGRSLAAKYVTEGRASIDGLPCTKPDKTVAQGMKISVRGLGKILLHSVGGQTKKGRISVQIHRYV